MSARVVPPLPVDRMGLLMAQGHPELVKRFLPLREEYYTRWFPWDLLPSSVLRSDAHQFALYLQGREALGTVNNARAVAGLRPITDAENAPGRVVTWRDGKTKRSDHQWVRFDGRNVSRALDVVATMDPDGPDGPVKPAVEWDDPYYLRLEPLAEKYGLVWGGKRDMPHLALPKDVP